MFFSTTTLILWVYIVLLIVGGLVGYLKAGSKISLIMSGAFAIPLGVCALGIWRPLVADALIAALLVVFVIRYAKGRKFMPAGLMIILSVLALVTRHLL